MTQMVYHFKALIQGIQNLYKNWEWHHPRGGHAQITKKTPLLLKLIYHLPGPKNSHFHSRFQYPLLRAFKRHIIEFPRSTGSKMAGRQSLKCESSFCFSGIFVVKQSFFGCSFHTLSFDDLTLGCLTSKSLQILQFCQ